jgi:hypothetical protein
VQAHCTTSCISAIAGPSTACLCSWQRMWLLLWLTATANGRQSCTETCLHATCCLAWMDVPGWLTLGLQLPSAGHTSLWTRCGAPLVVRLAAECRCLLQLFPGAGTHRRLLNVLLLHSPALQTAALGTAAYMSPEAMQVCCCLSALLLLRGCCMSHLCTAGYEG